ncbi:hypothetical protein F4778DRAFT_453369 [Xylariomycetidae sp. FL2044]|nr:hypothetical protein F4778DRAFT_453369 [Xylariomycetidae sp. FL2044]
MNESSVTRGDREEGVEQEQTSKSNAVHNELVGQYSDDELNASDTIVPGVVSDITPINQDSRRGRPSVHRAAQRSIAGPDLEIQGPRTHSQRTRIAVHLKSAPASQHNRHSPQPRHLQPQSSTPQRSRLRPKTNFPNMADNAVDALAFMEEKMEGSSSLQPKKRGRPKGWKPGMRSYTQEKREKKQAVETNEAGKEAKKRGRPAKPPPRTPRDMYLQSTPDYTPYLCEWKDTPETSCPAELQNLKFLRKHVYYIHGDGHPLVCRWGKCATVENPTQFADEKAFETHMEENHFEVVAWHRGEGYKNDGIENLKPNANKLPSYLFDKDGNQVTPSVKAQKLEDDQQVKDRKRKLRQLLMEKEYNAPSEEEYARMTLGLPELMGER